MRMGQILEKALDINAARSVYARWAPFYDQTFGAITQPARRTAARQVTGRPGSELLEVGVGTGLSLPHFPSGLRITGVDICEEMLAQARQRVDRLRISGVEALHRMDARDLGFASGRFDTVVAMHTLSVVPEPGRVMAEMVRVLKPGGRLVISNHFAREQGLMAQLTRRTARFADRIGWHSDFDIGIVTGTPGLTLVKRRRLPPAGLMTLLIFEKSATVPANLSNPPAEQQADSQR